MNALDRAIAWLSPALASRRAFDRVRLQSLQHVTAAYEGAARSNRTGWKRIAGGSSANSEIQRSLSRLRDVSRELVRNNPYAANIATVIPANVVGAGIIPAVVCDGKRTKKNLQGLVADHLDTPAIDFDGVNNLYGLQSLAMRTIVESGEVLVVRYTPPPALKLRVPVQVRVLEPDFLDGSKNGPIGGGNTCFDGIEFDSSGRRVAYWLFDEHPGGGLAWRMPTSRRVPASEVVHAYRVDRPGQFRGVPWGAPVVMTLWDLGDYEDAELVRQKIAACFAVFYVGDDKRGLAQSIQTGDSTVAGTPIETVEPGMIERVPAGVDVKFATPPVVTGFSEFVRAGARKVAMGYGVPYELATGDMSQVTFISGRLGMLQFNRSIDQWRWQMLIPHVCAGIGRWFLEAAEIPLGLPLAGVARLEWTPPRREMVSPKDEVPPIVASIRAGLTSRSEEVRKSGYDAEDIELEIAAENKRADDLGLSFESDGRRPAVTRGSEQVAAPDDANADPNADPNAPADDPNKQGA